MTATVIATHAAMSLVIPAPQPAAEETPIVSSTFFPNITPLKIREQQRIDNTITPPRLRAALIEAIAHTNSLLRAYRIAQQELGKTALADIDAERVDDESILVQRYRRAVGCFAKALILERMPDYDATGRGEKRAEAMADPIDDLRRDFQHAIAEITGRPRTVVELI